MLKYEAIPGGTNIPIRKGFEFKDWVQDEHILQKSTGTMNQTTTDTYQLQNENMQYVTNQKVDASTTYQGEMNSAFNRQTAETTGAVNAGKHCRRFCPAKCRNSNFRHQQINRNGKTGEST